MTHVLLLLVKRCTYKAVNETMNPVGKLEDGEFTVFLSNYTKYVQQFTLRLVMFLDVKLQSLVVYHYSVLKESTNVFTGKTFCKGSHAT